MGISSNVCFVCQVIKDSRLLGKTIIDLDIRRKYGLNVMEVRRGDAYATSFSENDYPEVCCTGHDVASRGYFVCDRRI